MKRLQALANLAIHFALHTLRAGARMMGFGRRRGGETFRAQFAPEGIFPLSAAEIAAIPRAQACIGCGLCEMGPNRAVTSAPAAGGRPWLPSDPTVPTSPDSPAVSPRPAPFSEPPTSPYPRWVLAAGFARALPTLPLPAVDLERPTARAESELLCPLGVPLDEVSAFLARPRA